MADTNRLRNLLDDFVYKSTPRNVSSSAPCTVGELNTAIANLKELLDEFIKELDES